MAFASMILIIGIMGAFTFMAVVALAAPKEPGAQNILQWMDEMYPVMGWQGKQMCPAIAFWQGQWMHPAMGFL